MKEISWKQHNRGARWEGSLSKFQFVHLLDLSEYWLYFTTEFCGKWREKSSLDVSYAPIVYCYIRDHLKSQWLKILIIIYYYHYRLTGLRWAALTWGLSSSEGLPGSLPRLGADFRRHPGAQQGLSTSAPTKNLSRWLWLPGHDGWILRRNAPRHQGGGCKASYNLALEAI